MSATTDHEAAFTRLGHEERTRAWAVMLRAFLEREAEALGDPLAEALASTGPDEPERRRLAAAQAIAAASDPAEAAHRLQSLATRVGGEAGGDLLIGLEWWLCDALHRGGAGNVRRFVALNEAPVALDALDEVLAHLRVHPAPVVHPGAMLLLTALDSLPPELRDHARACICALPRVEADFDDADEAASTAVLGSAEDVVLSWLADSCAVATLRAWLAARSSRLWLRMHRGDDPGALMVNLDGRDVGFLVDGRLRFQGATADERADVLAILDEYRA